MLLCKSKYGWFHCIEHAHALAIAIAVMLARLASPQRRSHYRTGALHV